MGATAAVNDERPAWTTWQVATAPTLPSNEITKSRATSGAAVLSNAGFNHRPLPLRSHRQIVAPAPAIPSPRRSMRTTCRCSPMRVQTRTLIPTWTTRAWVAARTLTWTISPPRSAKDARPLSSRIPTRRPWWYGGSCRGRSWRSPWTRTKSRLAGPPTWGWRHSRRATIFVFTPRPPLCRTTRPNLSWHTRTAPPCLCPTPLTAWPDLTWAGRAEAVDRCRGTLSFHRRYTRRCPRTRLYRPITTASDFSPALRPPPTILSSRGSRLCSCTRSPGHCPATTLSPKRPKLTANWPPPRRSGRAIVTRQTFPWPVAVIPTRVCLIRFDRPPSSLSLRAEQTFSHYTVSDHGFPGSSSCPRRFSRSFWKKGFLGDRYLWSRTWSRRTKQHPFAFCCSRSRVSLSYHRIRDCYISYFRLSMRTRPTRTVNVILFSIQKTTTVCRDNISSRSSISNVSSYTICKSHLLAYCLPASRAPIQLIRIMNILQWTYPVRRESLLALLVNCYYNTCKTR